jgi:hypothetical protein
LINLLNGVCPLQPINIVNFFSSDQPFNFNMLKTTAKRKQTMPLLAKCKTSIKKSWKYTVILINLHNNSKERLEHTDKYYLHPIKLDLQSDIYFVFECKPPQK